MGPLATADLFRKIIDVTEAERDQDHIRVLIDSNTNIPDRTKAILYDGADPVPEILKSAHMLEEDGADLLIMPCNTAHYYFETISHSVDIPMLSMIEETARRLSRMNIKKAGLLATDGTVESQIYSDTFKKYDIETIVPDSKGQNEVMKLIYKGVKAGNWNRDLGGFRKTLTDMRERKSELFVLGCTELPVAFQHYDFGVPVIDPTLELAKCAVYFVGGKIKSETKEKIC